MSEQQGIATLGEIAARVADAMESAAAEYGAEAIDLALLAYQVDAARSLVIAACIAAPLVFIRRIVVSVWAICAKTHDPGFLAAMAAVFFGGTYAVTLISQGLYYLLSPAYWMAAFGRPELLIATRALQAGGLL